MRAHVRNMAVVHHENEVGILHGRDALGNDDLRRLGDIGAEALADQRVGARVDRGGRVVEDQNLRLFEKRPGDAETLLLSAGDVRAALLDIGVIPVGEGADEFVRSFPDGYDTYIEQGGSNVSGGQKQRLCIARALLKKPKILILDDSTSAVDTRTDALIREGFRTYIPETTKIIIAQRVASVQDADLILVMDNGHIADMGTHEELLASSEIYREVYESQTNGGEQDEA